jgi:hypothetical protein
MLGLIGVRARRRTRAVLILLLSVIVELLFGTSSAFAQCVVESTIQPNDRVVGVLSADDCTFQQPLSFGFFDLYQITLPSE